MYFSSIALLASSTGSCVIWPFSWATAWPRASAVSMGLGLGAAQDQPQDQAHCHDLLRIFDGHICSCDLLLLRLQAGLFANLADVGGIPLQPLAGLGQLDVVRILDQLLARRILVEIVDGIRCPLPGRHVGPWQAADRMTDLDSDARKR